MALRVNTAGIAPDARAVSSAGSGPASLPASTYGRGAPSERAARADASFAILLESLARLARAIEDDSTAPADDPTVAAELVAAVRRCTRLRHRGAPSAAAFAACLDAIVRAAAPSAMPHDAVERRSEWFQRLCADAEPPTSRRRRSG